MHNFATAALYLLIGSIVLAMLPVSPFNAISTLFGEIPYLSWLNWFVPITEMLAIGQVWLGAITTFYIIQMLLRWLNIIT